MAKDINKTIIAALGAAAGGIGGVGVAALIALYDKVFGRCERPDYSVKPGMYNYELYGKTLPRENIKYLSDDVVLQGYYYKAKKSKGLVIVAHGIKSGADDYLPMIEYMVNNNYSVFAFDYKGTYDSQGESTVGMCESLVDLSNTIDFLSNDSRFKKMNKFLIGHSWGGYAVTSVLSIKDNIKACASIAGMNDGYTIIYEKGNQYAGKLADSSKPFLNVYQRYLFKSYVDLNGVKGINESNIPVLIAHGVEDGVISFKLQSIISKANEITNPNVKYFIGKGLQGDHCDIWHSNESIIYKKELESELKLKEIIKDDDLSYEEKQEFYKNVNHRLYSEVNKELFDEIIKMFDSTLN